MLLRYRTHFFELFDTVFDPIARAVRAMVASAVLVFACVVSLLPSVLAGERPQLVLTSLMPGLTIGFKIEPLGMVFALVASGLWILTSVYAIGYMRGAHEKHQTRFFACFSIAIFAAIGVAFAQNMFTLFVLYEVLSLSTYPLVAHKGNEEAKRGARVYLGLLLGTLGLAVVQVRSVLERRSELALLRSLGYSTVRVGQMLSGENLRLLAIGLGIGVGSAALAALPAWWRGQSIGSMWGPIGMLGMVLVCGIAAGALAVRQANRLPILDALRGK
jgi:multicomponent Na+:H+ antiporter subunit D